MHIRISQNAREKADVSGPIHHLLNQVGVRSKAVQFSMCPGLINDFLTWETCQLTDRRMSRKDVGDRPHLAALVSASVALDTSTIRILFL